MPSRTSITRRTVSSIVLILTACAPAYSAYVSPHPLAPISPGDRLRVTHNSQCCTSPSIGVDQSLNRDSLVLQSEGGTQRFVIARSSITQIDRWNRGSRHLMSGAIIGVLAGAAAGGEIGYQSGCGHCDGDWRPLTAIAGVIMGGGLGLLTGMLIGARHRGFWEPIPKELSAE